MCSFVIASSLPTEAEYKVAKIVTAKFCHKMASAVFESKGKAMRVSINATLLLWPLFIHHSCDNEIEYEGGCILTPISPPSNSRDVCDARLCNSLDTNMMDDTDSHIMIGMQLSGEPAEHSVHCLQMHSVFDRFLSNPDDKPMGFFEVKIKLGEMRSKVANLLRLIDISLPKYIHSCSSPEELVSVMLEKISLKYNHFKEASNYEQFISSMQQQHDATKLPICIRKGTQALQATYIFQQLFPYCITFLNGNHRHTRWLFQLFNLKRQECKYHMKEEDFIKEDVKDGYIIKPHYAFDNCNVGNAGVCFLIYHFFTICDAYKDTKLTLQQLQSISDRCNMVLRNSLHEESCHK